VRVAGRGCHCKCSPTFSRNVRSGPCQTLSHTIVLREVLALRHHGIDVHVVSAANGRLASKACWFRRQAIGRLPTRCSGSWTIQPAPDDSGPQRVGKCSRSFTWVSMNSIALSHLRARPPMPWEPMRVIQ
jgi:hypothetical protein